MSESLTAALASFGLIEEVSSNDHDAFARDAFETFANDESIRRIAVIGGLITDEEVAAILDANDDASVIVLHATYANDVDSFKSLHGKVSRSTTASKQHNRTTYGDARVGKARVTDEGRGLFYITR